MEHYGSAIGSGNDTSRVLDSVKIHFPQKVIHLELSTSLSFSLCKYIRQSGYCTWTDPDYNRTLLSICRCTHVKGLQAQMLRSKMASLYLKWINENHSKSHS